MATLKSPMRDLDLCIWGATGFTGQLAVAYLAGDPTPFYSFKLQPPSLPKNFRFALVGRSLSKLNDVKTRCKADAEIIVAESSDKAAIEAFVKRTKVVAAFAGPFVKYSDLVIEACAKYGTHFIDITGETDWVRWSIDRYGDMARATGACIVNHCGYDSIPSDLGCLFATTELRKQLSDLKAPVRRVQCFQAMMGATSGGSLQTSLAPLTHAIKLSNGVNLEDPFLIGGVTENGVRDEDEFQTTCAFNSMLGAWTAPFMMEKINARTTRRSSALIGYGPNFNYQETIIVPSEKIAKKMVQQRVNPIHPNNLKKLIDAGRLPKAGEGPSPKVRATSKFVGIFVAEADDEARTTSITAVSGGEAGYEETAKMAIESALTLLLHPNECPGFQLGGFQTPAACMGYALVRRLQAAGIKFETIDNPKKILAATLGGPSAKL